MWSLWLSKQKTPDPGSYRRHQMVFSLICAGISGWANSRYAGDLRRSCAHYDVTVMIMKSREKSFRITGSVSGKAMVNKGKLRRFHCQTIDCRFNVVGKGGLLLCWFKLFSSGDILPFIFVYANYGTCRDFTWVKLTKCQHCFKKWCGTERAASHYLNQR